MPTILWFSRLECFKIYEPKIQVVPDSGDQDNRDMARKEAQTVDQYKTHQYKQRKGEVKKEKPKMKACHRSSWKQQWM